MSIQGASSLDASMQLAELDNDTFSKQQCNPDPKNAGQKEKGRNLGPTAKRRVPKMVNCPRAVQMALLPLQKTSRSPNFLENVLFSRKQAIKLLITGRKPTCSICLGCLA